MGGGAIPLATKASPNSTPYLKYCFRVHNPQTKSCTWFNRSHSVRCRLDRFHTPLAWRPNVRENKHIVFPHSDHHLVICKLSVGLSNPRGQGVWKFITQLLKSESFCSDVNDFWIFWQTQLGLFTDPRVWWDAGKFQLKELSISHGIETANNRKRDKAALEREFRDALDKPPSPHISARLLLLKEQLSALEDELVSGSIIRSKEQWTALGVCGLHRHHRLRLSTMDGFQNLSTFSAG